MTWTHVFRRGLSTSIVALTAIATLGALPTSAGRRRLHYRTRCPRHRNSVRLWRTSGSSPTPETSPRWRSQEI